MKYIDIHTHRPQQTDVIQVNVRDFAQGERIQTPLDCIGIHPWSLPLNQQPRVLESFEAYIAEHSPWMIGEIGIDRSISQDLTSQKDLFTQQIDLAVKYKIGALTLHSVRAHSDILEILKSSNYSGKILLHDFNSNQQIAEQYLKNFESYFSFGKKLLITDSSAFKVFSHMELENILLETDSADNIDIFQVYDQAARIKKIELNKLKTQISRNFTKISNALFTESTI